MMVIRIIRMPADGTLDDVFFYAGDDYDSDYNDFCMNWMMMTKINRMITMMSKPNVVITTGEQSNRQLRLSEGREKPGVS